MKNKSNIILSLLLVIIAIIAIVRFVHVSDALGDKTDITSETTVTSESSQISDSTQISESLQVSGSVEASVTTDEGKDDKTQVSDNKEDDKTQVSDGDKKEETEEEKHERLKKQSPNIMKNIQVTDCDFVFIGDSIFVFGDEDNDSIPDNLASLYDITVYDCSRVGIASGQNTNEWVSQYDLAKCFAKRKNTKGEGCDLFNYSLNRYIERDHSGRQLVFFLDCCINDYYQGTPMTEGKDSFVAGYERTLYILKEYFPDAIIICTVPNDVVHEEMGYNYNSAGYTYNMYKDAIYDVAADFNVFCLRFDNPEGIDRDNAMEFLADGTHPNEAGRERMAATMVEYVNSILRYVSD